MRKRNALLSLTALVSFKRAYRDSVEVVRVLLGAACPEETEEQIQDLILALFPFIHGIYPYAFHTEKQRQAMEQAGISLEERSIYDLALGGFLKILGVDETTP